MPYKDKENGKQRQALCDRSPFGRFRIQRSTAKQRGIEWKLCFEDWCEIWQDSGFWGQRGKLGGYVMCRKGDIGPYSIDNIYIAHCSVNSKDLHTNNRMPIYGRQKLTIEQIREVYLRAQNCRHYTRDAKELAIEYGVDYSRVMQIKKTHKWSSSI